MDNPIHKNRLATALRIVAEVSGEIDRDGIWMTEDNGEHVTALVVKALMTHDRKRAIIQEKLDNEYLIVKALMAHDRKRAIIQEKLDNE